MFVVIAIIYAGMQLLAALLIKNPPAGRASAGAANSSSSSGGDLKPRLLDYSFDPFMDAPSAQLRPAREVQKQITLGSLLRVPQVISCCSS